MQVNQLEILGGKQHLVEAPLANHNFSAGHCLEGVVSIFVFKNTSLLKRYNSYQKRSKRRQLSPKLLSEDVSPPNK